MSHTVPHTASHTISRPIYNTNYNSISNLPDELIRKIINHLPPHLLHAISKVNRHINSFRMTDLLLPEYINGTLTPGTLSPSTYSYIKRTDDWFDTWHRPTFIEILNEYITKIDKICQTPGYTKTKFKHQRFTHRHIPEYKHIKLQNKLKIWRNPTVNALV